MSHEVRWVLLHTEGTAMTYPAEVYADQERAVFEAERWADILAAERRVPVVRPFTGRWEVGDVWIRLVPADLPDRVRDLWVGTHWTHHGFPEPEAALFGDAEEARSWAIEQPLSGSLVETYESPWSFAAVFRLGDEEEHSYVQRAKVVR
jgi:hypothetical protein